MIFLFIVEILLPAVLIPWVISEWDNHDEANKITVGIITFVLFPIALFCAIGAGSASDQPGDIAFAIIGIIASLIGIVSGIIWMRKK